MVPLPLGGGNRGALLVGVSRPDAPQGTNTSEPGFVPFILVDKVHYRDAAPWPGADGNGQSLQRINPDEYGNDPINWSAATPTPGPQGGNPDTDGDGMPNDWELANGFNPNDPSDAALDADGDGMTNLQEYLAGTDPRNGASFLRILITGAGPAVLEFTAQLDRTYTIEYKNTLNDPAWVKFADVPAGAQRPIVINDPSATSTRFYRLRTPQTP